MKTKTSEEIDVVTAEYDRLVPPVYQTREFPNGYKLKPLDWALSDAIIKRDKIRVKIEEKETEMRPISTMDIEFLSNDIVRLAKEGKVDLGRNYPCGLKCPGCF